MDTPESVREALAKLEASDRETVEAYIELLQSELNDKEAALKALQGQGATTSSSSDRDMPSSSAAADEPMPDAVKEEDIAADGDQPFPPIYESGEDFDKAADCKEAAADFKSSGDLDQALAKYTEAVLAAPPSALLYANRATVLLQLGRLRAAERDCNLALHENPDSAKALRVRGKVRKELGMYEEALKDLSASQAIDFDEGTVEDLKFLTQLHVEKEKADAEKRVKEEEKLRKRAEDIKKAREEAKRDEAERARSGGGMYDDMPDVGGMPGMGGMPGGMPGMGGMPGGMESMMGNLMSDPELLADLQKPKVQAAFQELMSGPDGPMGLMSNPAKLQELMLDPEVGPVLQKFMAKVGGGAMAPGMGGTSAAPKNNDNDDDLPDLEEIPDIN